MEIKSIKDYLLQVSLILVSLFIAFGINRCSENAKDADKLALYRSTIIAELERELESTEYNLADCENDIDDLQQAAIIFSQELTDQTLVAVGGIGRVFVRGVFRTFPPSTYDLMADSGDALLIKDLQLRKDLAATSAFRDDYVKADLFRHDEMTIRAIKDMGQFIDVICLANAGEGEYAGCIEDQAGLFKHGGAYLTPLLRHSELRAFHLDNYRGQVEQILASMRQNPG